MNFFSICKGPSFSRAFFQCRGAVGNAYILLTQLFLLKRYIYSCITTCATMYMLSKGRLLWLGLVSAGRDAQKGMHWSARRQSI